MMMSEDGNKMLAEHHRLKQEIEISKNQNSLETIKKDIELIKEALAAILENQQPFDDRTKRPIRINGDLIERLQGKAING